MEFVFKPEKLGENLSYEISEAIAKRTEIFSRKKLPGLWQENIISRVFCSVFTFPAS